MFILYDVYKLYGYYTFFIALSNFFKENTYALKDGDSYLLNGTPQTKLAYMMCKGLFGKGIVARYIARYLIVNSRRINYRIRVDFLLYALDNKEDIYDLDDYFIENFNKISYQGVSGLFERQTNLLARISEKVIMGGENKNSTLYAAVTNRIFGK